MTLSAAAYSADETLRNGRRVEIRAFKPSDRSDFLAAVARTSTMSLYRRFFAIKREFSDRETNFFLNVDFVNHVALVARTDDAGRSVIAGGGRYIVVQPGTAELAFVVTDEFQGQGIGAVLMRHLAIVARAARLQVLIAEVLSENTPMLKVFEKCGLAVTTKSEGGFVQVTLRLD